MKNIFYILIVCLLSGIGIFFIVSGVSQLGSLDGLGPWRFDPMMIGIGAAFIVGAVLLYKNEKNKSK